MSQINTAPVSKSSGVRVLWVEADDEAQSSIAPRRPVHSLAAYLLLADEVVLHTAYVFQSTTTHDLVLGPVGSAMGAGPMRLFLSQDKTSAADYMSDRIHKAQHAEVKALPFRSEWNEYSEWTSEQLKADQISLDNRFTASGAILSAGWSRDREFRRLLAADVRDAGRLGDTVSALLIRDPVQQHETHNLLRQLADLAEDTSRLMSADVILGAIVLSGPYTRDTLREIHHRLHVLHWACHIGDTVRVPFVQRETDTAHLDPYDSHIFWHAFGEFLGAPLKSTLLHMSDLDLISTCLALRNDGTWLNFRVVYRQVVEAIDELDIPIEEATVERALQLALPSRRKVVLKRLTALPLISMVVGAIRAAFGDPAGGFQAAGGVSQTLRQIVTAIGVYNTSWAADVKLAVRSALRRTHPELLDRPDDVVHA